VNKRLTLVASILASSVVFLDGSVVNVALPALRADLHAGLATQQWVVEAYLLTLGALILAGGSYADIHGRKHALMLGTAGFAVTSALCAAAPTAEVLVVARALQGVAGALLVPASLAVLTATFDDPEERGAAVGTWTAWTGIAFVIGPLAGGTIVDAISWRGVFALNLPLAAVTLWLTARAVAESKDPDAAGSVDVPAAVLSVIWLGGAVLALIEQPHRGWGDPLVAGPLAAAAIAFPMFIWRELHCPHPMLPLGLFKIRNFSAVNAATFAIYGGLGAFTFFLVLYLQQVAGYSAFEGGAALVPITVVMFFLSKRFGALAMRIGPRVPMTVGPLIAAVGLFLLTSLDSHPSYLEDVLPGVLLFSLGLSATVAPLTATALSSVEQHRAGIASGVNNAVARIAGLVAIAVVGAVVSSQFSSTVDHRLPPAVVKTVETRPLVTAVPPSVPPGQRAEARKVLVDASQEAFRAGMTLAAALVAAGGLISVLGVRGGAASADAARARAATPTAT
jgi:EmrB/QacA subfamily drug resistance transporter